jgi:hypothetical protein
MRENNIVLFSAGRTGSTYIWQILKEIFPNTHKAHEKEMREGFFDKKYDCVLTQRNKVDSYLSRLKAVYCNGDNEEFLNKIKDTSFLFSSVEKYKDELNYVDYVKRIYEGRILVLDYDKFFDNSDFVFNCLEKFFGIDIDVKERFVIDKKTNRLANLKIQKNFQNFKTQDEESMIKGSHIWSDKDDYSRDLLTEDTHKLLTVFFNS